MTPIQRMFRDLQENSSEAEQADLLSRIGLSTDFGWDVLLRSKRILIVSEAGAGKSHECREQARLLYAQGQPAFYVELASLAQHGMPSLMHPEEEARFNDWKLGKAGIAVFFLDSVDELKLTAHTFASTLKLFRREIGDKLDRVRVVLTSRPGPTDLRLVREHLPIPKPAPHSTQVREFADIMVDPEEPKPAATEETAPQEWRYVGLVPLSNDQIRQFATNRRVADPEKLLGDILRRDAEDFARRPLDLIALCDDWQEGRRVRRLQGQIERNIEVKLAARIERDEPAPLSAEKARDGACRLALTALLTRNFTIRYRAEADRSDGADAALDPARVLPDWTLEERRALLERGLFSFAGYGRVRFHHRSIWEYLAAERIDQLISRGMSIKTVKRLLFEEAFGNVKLVRPRMRPIAAWLATRHESIFAEILDREPEVMLDHADPSVLDLGQRERALRAYVDRYGRGRSRGMYVPRIQVRRFASPDLAPEVKRLWARNIENPEVRKLICELIDAAELVSCAEIATKAAKDPQEDDYVRLAAIRALTKTDQPAVAELARSMDSDQASWPDSLLRFVIPLLFPTDLTVNQLLGLLARRKAPGRRHDSFEWIMGNAISEAALDPESLTALCAGLKMLVQTDLIWEAAWPHLATKRPELILALAEVCLRLVDLRTLNSEAVEAAILVVKLSEHGHRTEKKVTALRKYLAALPESGREIAFWLADAIVAKLHLIVDPWARLYETAHRGPITLNFAADRAWITRILADTRRSKVERHMMLYAMTHFLANEAVDRHAFLTSLRMYVQDDKELTSQLISLLTPTPIDARSAELASELERRKVEAESRKSNHRDEWAAFQRRLKDDPDTAFSEEKTNNTCWNLWGAMRRSEDGRADAGWDPAFTEAHFGPEIVARLRKAMRSIWRKHTPTLWHERAPEERNTHYTIGDFGLAALHAEAEAPDWARHLDVADAELAARYAAVQLNGFPKWLESLVESQADAVERTLGPAVIAELDETIGDGAAAMTLQSVRYAPARVAKIFAPRLKDWLTCHHRRFVGGDIAPPGLSQLWNVSDILVAHDGDAASWLVPIAASALSGTPSKAFDTFWLSILFRLDPAKGTDALERQLAKTEPAHLNLAIGWFAGIFGDSREPSVDLSHAGFTPGILSRLVKLAYRHVRPDSDLVHEDVFTPNTRDDAESARNRLLGVFLDTKGPESWRMKVEMADDPLIAHFRDRFRILIREKLAEEIDADAMSEEQVVKLERSFEVAPRTRDEMSRLLRDRLDDLDDLLNQDDSPRDAWALIKIEKMMRREIARALRQSARGAYTISQEEVTGDENETDIRLHSTASEQQGVIEVKIAEQKAWTGRVLRDTLRTQIVAKYMRPENCRVGYLLVTVASDRSWDDPDTCKSLDIDGLREMLEREAGRIESENGGSLRLFVKVLDLRPRLAKG